MPKTAYGKAPWGKSPYGGEPEVLYTSDRLPIVGTVFHEDTRSANLTHESTIAGTISTETGIG